LGTVVTGQGGVVAAGVGAGQALRDGDLVTGVDRGGGLVGGVGERRPGRGGHRGGRGRRVGHTAGDRQVRGVPGRTVGPVLLQHHGGLLPGVGVHAAHRCRGRDGEGGGGAGAGHGEGDRLTVAQQRGGVVAAG